MLKVVGASWMQIRMSTWIIGMVLVLGIVVIILGEMGQLEEDGNYSATAYWDEETGFEIKFWGQGMEINKIPKGVARVYFQPHINTNGWAIIDVETQPNYPDWVQAYAAGMLEGSLSWQYIYWHWKNTIQSTCENRTTFCNYIRKYLEENWKSVKTSYEKTDDPYWHQVHLFYIQIEGMQQGFEHGVKRSRQNIEELTFVDFLWINAASDIVDLEYKFFDTKPYLSTPHQPQEKYFMFDSTLLRRIRNKRSPESYSINDHRVKGNRPHIGCGVTLSSAFIKLVPEIGRLFVAHNSAGPYVSMLKMIKHYNLRYHWSVSNFWMIENKLTFSSYPGAIHSMDDFYVISIRSEFVDLIVTGTPLTVFNKTLWSHVSPYDQVLSGPRTIAASRLSNNASTWAKTLSKYNSGTGNKQWIIVDVERFENISQIREANETKYEEELAKAKNILWVVEQIPGEFVMEDQTDLLKTNSYWASYGLPFYKNISIDSGVEAIRNQFGDAFSYENTPLAKIYRRDNLNATSLNSIMNLMRSNTFRKDPLSLGNPRCAIGARGDIQAKGSHSFPIGVTDSKIYSVGKDANQSEEDTPETVLQVIAGPAYSMTCTTGFDEIGQCLDDDRLEPFSWTDSIFSEFPHNGHPDDWNFKPINISLRD